MVAANFAFLFRVLLLTGAVLLYMFASPSRADNVSAGFVVPTESLFVPQNFDDNDQAEVVLDGWLQSGCDRLLAPQVEVMADLGIINVAAIATRDEIAKCLPVITRYTTVVQLGVLPQGNWEVRTNGGDLAQALPVAEALSRGSGEDEVYATIDRVYADYAPDRAFDSRWMVVLMGRYRTTCEVLDTVRVTDDSATIEVIPTVRYTGAVCAPQMIPFIERRFMPDITTAGRYLLRARSAGGGAVNYVFSAFE